ncbi:MAG: hypothetical protein JWR09_5799, partial [Mucilaginibacter sp.]|nr:hypothetical protein [Mucilaginibacter sp.]
MARGTQIERKFLDGRSHLVRGHTKRRTGHMNEVANQIGAESSGLKQIERGHHDADPRGSGDAQRPERTKHGTDRPDPGSVAQRGAAAGVEYCIEGAGRSLGRVEMLCGFGEDIVRPVLQFRVLSYRG